MRILLPPSETKASGGSGPPLCLETLAFPELTQVRSEVQRRVIALARDRDACRHALGISVRQDHEIERNATLLTQPTMPAWERYTGVLYDALGVETLPRGARARAHGALVICSALFGALRPGDAIPAYRLSGGSALPDVGTMASVWREVLVSTLAHDGLVLDLRSSAYVALAPLPGALNVRVVARDGRAVSHHNKAAKGALSRAILLAPRLPTTRRTLVFAARRAGLALRVVDERTVELVVGE